MKLSIITINRNNAIGLRRTIQSVVSQTITMFEYIVIDGASTDGSVDIIKEFDNSIDYWISEHDSGIYNAMNKGIKEAKGEYCLFLNSGDYLATDCVIEDVLSMETDADIICGNSQGVKPDGTLRTIYAPKYFALREVIGGVPHQSEFIKTDLFKSYGGYDEMFSILSDLDFNVKVCLKDVTYCNLKKLISIVDMDGISCNDSNFHKMEREYQLIKRKYLPQRVWDDYSFFMDRKGLGNPSIKWLLDNKFLLKVVKLLHYIFVK